MSAFSKVDSAALFEGLLGGEDWLWGVTVAVGILAAANYYDHLAEMGIEEGMLRINVGLEDPQDLIDDLDRALQAVGL